MNSKLSQSVLKSLLPLQSMISDCLHLLLCPVGFHHYILENFTGDNVDGLSEREVLEFDPPSEVCTLE